MRTPASPSRAARFTATAAVLLAAGVLALAPAVSASAHDYLISSSPAAGSTQTKPVSKVVLTFDDRVLDLSGDGSSNVVEVTHGTTHFETGCAKIADTEVTVPVALGSSGDYTVTWQIVSADGHTVSSSIDFDYAKPPGAAAADGRSARPTCGDQSSSGSRLSGQPSAGSGGGSAAGSVNDQSSDSSSVLPIALGVGGGIVVVALLAVAFVVTRGRADTTADEIAHRSGQRQQPKRADRSSKKPPPPGD